MSFLISVTLINEKIYFKNIYGYAFLKICLWKHINWNLEGKMIYFLLSFYFSNQRSIVCIFLGFKAKTHVQVDLETDLSHYRPGWSIPIIGWIKREGRKASLLYKCTEKFQKSGVSMFFLINRKVTVPPSVMNANHHDSCQHESPIHRWPQASVGCFRS